MDDPKDEPLESPHSSNAEMNPYAATLHATAPEEPVKELPVANSRATLYTIVGALLAVGVVMGFVMESMSMILGVFLVRVTWVVVALRFSQRFAMHLGIKVPFALVLMLHLVVLALEVIAFLLFAVCLAVVLSTQ